MVTVVHDTCDAGSNPAIGADKEKSNMEWHNLKENPNDLPEQYKCVLVAYKWDKDVFHCDHICYDVTFYDPYARISEGKCNWYGAGWCDLLGWMYIPEFDIMD